MKECRGLQAQGFECNFEGAAVGGSRCENCRIVG
jgi:hypothetical protein